MAGDTRDFASDIQAEGIWGRREGAIRRPPSELERVLSTKPTFRQEWATRLVTPERAAIVRGLMTRWFVLPTTLLAATLAAGTAAALPTSVPIVSVDDLRPGQTAVVKTVFE